MPKDNKIPILCVPIQHNTNEHQLCNIFTFPDYERPVKKWTSWASIKEVIRKNRFYALQQYFIDHYNLLPCYTEFNLLTYKDNILIDTIGEETKSIFLGLFLQAAVSLLENRYKFKKEYDIIYITGDLEYENGKLKLKEVDKIEEKYKCVKKYSDDNNDKEIVFLYISNKKIKLEKKTENIKVKYFTPENSIEDIFRCVFKFDYNYNLDDINLSIHQKKHMAHIINDIYGYYAGKEMHNIEKPLLNDLQYSNWHTLYLYGVGGTGKTATAKAVARHLIWLGRVNIPLWINIDNKKLQNIKEDIRAKLEKESLNSNKQLFEQKCVNINRNRDWTILYKKRIEKYLLNKIIDLLNIKNTSDTPKILKEKRLFLNDYLTNSINRYIFIFDNIILPEKDIEYLINAIGNIFNKLLIKPYIIFTSKLKYDYKKYKLENIKLSNITKVPKFGFKHFKHFINNILIVSNIEKSKLYEINNNNKYEFLLESLHKKISFIPQLVITTIKLLLYKPIDYLLNIVKSSNYDNDLCKKIYKEIFELLSLNEKIMLYRFLYFKDDIFIPLDQLIHYYPDSEYTYIKREEANKELKKEYKKYFKQEFEISEKLAISALNTLVNYCLIDHNDNSYMIKSVTFSTFLFEDEFIGPLMFSGEYLRDTIIRPKDQLEIALRYDQDADKIRKLFNKLKTYKENNIINYFYTSKIYDDYDNPENVALALEYSSKPEVLSLFKNEYYFNRLLEKGGTPFLAPLSRNKSSKIFEWFNENGFFTYLLDDGLITNAILNNNLELLEYIYNNFVNYINNEVSINAAYFHNLFVLKWLHSKSKKYLEIIEHNKNLFHYAIETSDLLEYKNKDCISVLDYLYKKIKIYLNVKYNINESLFFYAWRYSNINAFNWLITKAPNLLLLKSKNKENVYHLLLNMDTIDILKWPDNNYTDKKILKGLNLINKYLPKRQSYNMLYEQTNKLKTIFHIAVEKDRNITILGWLLKKTSEKLLRKRDESGKTIFHYAVKKNDLHSALSPLHFINRNIDENNTLKEKYYKLIPELRLVKKDSNEFDKLIEKYFCTIVLNWIYNNIPDMLLKADYEGCNVFHYAAAYGYPVFLEWIIEREENIINTTDKNKRNAFHYAASKEGNCDTILWLCNNEKTKQLIKESDNKGRTVFHYAAETIPLNYLLIETLFKLSPELLDTPDEDGNLPKNYKKIKNYLLSNKTDTID